jgi:hypothetical protein
LCLQLAEHLHQPFHVVYAWDWEELSDWVAYFQLKKKE